MMRARHRLAMVLTMAALGCNGATMEPTADTSAAVVAVHVTTVRQGPIESRLTVSGETAAVHTLRLAAPVAGRIVTLDVQAGDRITHGAVAARVLPLESEAAAHGLELLSGAGALDPTETISARRLAQRVADQAITLAAPFDGIVAERLHNPGEHVGANEALLELYDPRSLIVLAHVPIDAAAAIQPGQAVAMEMEPAGFDGHVIGMQTAVTPDSLTVPVRIGLASPPRLPLLHAAVQCHILLARHDDALLVPRTALTTASAGDDAAVMVVMGTRIERRAVRLGIREAHQVEVTRGLSAGDRVLSDGGFALPEGTAVSPIED